MLFWAFLKLCVFSKWHPVRRPDRRTYTNRPRGGVVLHSQTSSNMAGRTHRQVHCGNTSAGWVGGSICVRQCVRATECVCNSTEATSWVTVVMETGDLSFCMCSVGYILSTDLRPAECVDTQCNILTVTNSVCCLINRKSKIDFSSTINFEFFMFFLFLHFDCQIKLFYIHIF